MWPGVRLEALGHLGEQAAEGLHGNLALAVQDLHEARHVRAFEVVRQVHVHVEVGDRVLLARGAILHLHGVIDVLDADLVDRDLAGIGAALHVFDGDDAGLGGGGRVHVGLRCNQGPHSLRALRGRINPSLEVKR